VSRSVRVTRAAPVVAGLGCVARRSIRRGECLFWIPRAACLVQSPAGGTGGASQQPRDSQADLARQLLSKKSESAAWWPLIETLRSPAACPWTWSREERELLRGTDLGEVVRRKVRRVRHEWVDHFKNKATSLRAYAEATATVASHLNPWFGGAIVPFSCLLNHAPGPPNVVFGQRGDAVAGVAVRPIAPGTELTQAYADSLADLIYRYGFASGARFDEDVVSLVVGKDLEILQKDDDNAMARLLSASLAIEPSPWDGLEDVSTVELGASGEGLAKLLAVGFAASHHHVARRQDDEETSELDETRSEGRDASDDAAARLVAVAAGLDVSACLATARAHGGDGRDPWPALVRDVAIAARRGRRQRNALDAALDIAGDPSPLLTNV